MPDKDKIEMMFSLMEYDELTDSEHNLIISFEKTFKRYGTLSARQTEILEEIFDRAAGRVEWSR